MQKTRGVTEGNLCACGHMECESHTRKMLTTYEQLHQRLERVLSAEQLSEAGVEKALKTFRELSAALRAEMRELQAYKEEYARSVAEYYKRELVNVSIRKDQPLKRYTFDEVQEDELSSKVPKQKKKKKSKQQQRVKQEKV